jgi:hypothetical protein
MSPRGGRGSSGDINRGTETQQSATDFDANGNLLGLNNIGNLEWHYNNTLNKLIKADKTNANNPVCLHEVTGVLQEILKAFLVLSIEKRYHQY